MIREILQLPQVKKNETFKVGFFLENIMLCLNLLKIATVYVTFLLCERHIPLDCKSFRGGMGWVYSDQLLWSDTNKMFHLAIILQKIKRQSSDSV